MDYQKLLGECRIREVDGAEQSFLQSHIKGLSLHERLNSYLHLSQAKSKALRDWAGLSIGYEYLGGNVDNLPEFTDRVHPDYLSFASSNIGQLTIDERAAYVVQSLALPRDRSKWPENEMPSHEWSEREFALLPLDAQANAVASLLTDSDPQKLQWAARRLAAMGAT